MQTRSNLIQVWLIGALLLPAAVQAQFVFTTNDDNTITITGYTAGYTGPDIYVVIPDTTNGYPVTGIGDAAFYGCIKLAGITIPDSITNIGSGAFNSCLSLTNVTIPASVISIGDYAFFYCTNLLAITVDTANPSYSSLDGVLFNKDRTTLMQFPFGKAGSYSIPSSVTSLADEAFGINNFGYPSLSPPSSCTGLTNLTVPGSITNLGDYAFAHCVGLTSVTLSNGIAAFGNYAFFDCTSLTNIAIPGSVASMGYNTFDYCTSLANVTIGDGVPSIEGADFADCWMLNNVTIPDSVTNIGQYAFYACHLTNVTIPGGVTSLGDYAFSGCAFTNITIPNGVISIGNDSFEYCANLTGITLGSNITSIGNLAFSSCTSLTNIIIPDNVTTIGHAAFYYCPSLATVTVGQNVTSIGDIAFAGCTNLSSVFFRGNAPSNVGFGVFTGSGIYFGENIEIIYYLPDTTGWEATFAERPTALWLPVILTNDSSFGVRTNQFGFNMNWASGQTVVVEANTNLANSDWQPLQTNMLTTGSAYFSDPQWTNHPGRFYRLRSP